MDVTVAECSGCCGERMDFHSPRWALVCGGVAGEEIAQGGRVCGSSGPLRSGFASGQL